MIRLPRTALHCPACRHLASTASSSSAAFASSSRSASSKPSSRPRLAAAPQTVAWTRGVATEAAPRPQEQEHEVIEEEQEEPEREVAAMLEGLASEATARSETEEMDALLASFEASLDPEPSASFASFAEPLSAEPAAPLPPTPSLSPSTLLAPSFPSGPPSPSDLDALAPRSFHTPDATSPDSHRLIYSRLWHSTLTRLEKAFTKTQLLSLISLSEEKGGLGLDFQDPRWKQNQKSGRSGGKNWQAKDKNKMSKKELVSAVLVLRWGMTNPDVLPSGRKGPQKVDSVTLTDRTLFLLLSPNSTTIPLLTRQLGLSYSFARHAETGALSLVLRGNVKSVDLGRREVEGVAEAAHTRLLRLPAPASTLRPEVYQSVSRMAKAFLEPAAEQGEDVLRATATEERYLERLERYLLAAFSHDAARRSLPHYIALPTALSSTSYSFLPFAPPFRAPFVTGGSTSTYARIKSVGLASEAASRVDGSEAKSPFEELMSWSGKMGIEPLERVALGSIDSPVTSQRQRGQGILSTLSASLPSATEADEGVEYELTGSFGHVLWPLYPTGEGRLGPAMEDEWGVQQLLDWRTREGCEARTTWVGSPPTNFLPSTGVLTPTSVSSPLEPLSPFASLSTLTSSTPPSDIVAQGPKLDNEGFRRVIYRPVELEGGNRRVEIDFEGGLKIRSRKLVDERAVEVLVPTGSTDFKVTLTKRRELSESAVPDLAETTRDAPSQIFVESEPYLLDTDRWMRRTVIEAPSSPPTSSSPTSQLASAFATSTPSSIHSQQIQETFHDRMIEGSRGVTVSVELASPSRLSGDGGDIKRALEQLQTSGAWKRALEGMERRACESYEASGSRLKGAGDVSQRVFSAGR